MAETLMEGLLSEIERCSKLKVVYDEIPSGVFGALMIQQAIDNAKAAIASGDIEEMIRCFKACEGCCLMTLDKRDRRRLFGET